MTATTFRYGIVTTGIVFDVCGPQRVDVPPQDGTLLGCGLSLYLPRLDPSRIIPRHEKPTGNIEK
jgi:hypothetical protein